MILEGVLTTLHADGHVNIAPMGPRIEGDFQTFVLRPFRSSTTYHNLKRTGAGVFHVVDDVLLIARTAVGRRVDVHTRPAAAILGAILPNASRYYELQVVSEDETGERALFRCQPAQVVRLADFFGFNRAKHAVLEAAILATRLHILPRHEIDSEFNRMRTIVEKTGGNAECEAFALLEAHVAAHVSTPIAKPEAR